MRKFIIFLFAFCLFDFAQSMLLPFLPVPQAGHFLYSQWVQQTIPVNKPITGIEFTDSLKGWACTGANSSNDTGFILNTTNGGTNWLIQSQYTSVGFADIDMLNAQTGYAGGFLFGTGISKVYKTTNGGTIWIDLNVPNNMYVDDIFFITPDSGYVCNGLFGPDVRVTTNGGQTWQIRTSGISTETTRLFFLNFNTGWVGAGFTLYKTINGGINWNANGNFLGQTKSIYFKNITIGWVGLTNDRLVYTSNGGLNWIYQTLPPACCGSTTDLFFFDSLKGFAGNRNIKILKTYDAGQLWGYQVDSGASYRISFTDTSKGWSGDFGIRKTTNGGGLVTYVGLVNNNEVPNAYTLYQNYPNPFNSQTTIKFALSRGAYAELKIYDILGKEKTIWKSSSVLQAGTHELRFDAQDFSSGVYFYQLTVLNEELSIVYKETRKMILLK